MVLLTRIKSLFTIKTAFFAYLIKCLVLSPTATDATIMVGLIASFTIYKYFIYKIPDPSVKLQKEIENLKGAVSAIKLGGAISRGPDEKKSRLF